MFCFFLVSVRCNDNDSSTGIRRKNANRISHFKQTATEVRTSTSSHRVQDGRGVLTPSDGAARGVLVVSGRARRGRDPAWGRPAYRPEVYVSENTRRIWATASATRVRIILTGPLPVSCRCTRCGIILLPIFATRFDGDCFSIGSRVSLPAARGSYPVVGQDRAFFPSPFLWSLAAVRVDPSHATPSCRCRCAMVPGAFSSCPLLIPPLDTVAVRVASTSNVTPRSIRPRSLFKNFFQTFDALFACICSTDFRQYYPCRITKNILLVGQRHGVYKSFYSSFDFFYEMFVIEESGESVFEIFGVEGAVNQFWKLSCRQAIVYRFP